MEKKRRQKIKKGNYYKVPVHPEKKLKRIMEDEEEYKDDKNAVSES